MTEKQLEEISRMTIRDVLKRWPLIVSHIIGFSSGYATPTVAAQILLDAILGKENYCEWIMECYKCNPFPVLQGAIKHRHCNVGPMGCYKAAKKLVTIYLENGKEPLFSSWQ